VDGGVTQGVLPKFIPHIKKKSYQNKSHSADWHTQQRVYNIHWFVFCVTAVLLSLKFFSCIVVHLRTD